MHFTEYDTRLAAYVLLTDDDDRVLLSWFRGDPRNPACWSVPGGGVEFDESVQNAAVREVYEETGYHIALGGLVGEHHFTTPATTERRPFRSQRFFFAGEIIGGELGTVEEDGSTEFAAWVPITDVAAQPDRSELVTIALRLLAARSPG